MFSFAKKSTPTYAVFLSLTSSEVATALVRTSTKVPEVIYTSSRPVTLRKEMDTSALTASTEAAVVTALTELLHDQAVAPHITELHCVLSSPWVVAQTKTLLSTYDTPRTITKTTITDLISAEKKSLQGDYTDIVFIEEKICLTKVNGYEVESISSTTATSLEVSFVISTTATAVIDMLERIVHEHLPRVTVEFHSALLLEYSTLSRLYPDIKDCVFVDIHGEVTDIIALGGGVPRYTGSFPLGIREFVQMIARHLKVSHTIADSTLKLHANNAHDTVTTDKVDTAITTTGSAWVKHFDESMKEIGDTMIMPCKILVSADAHQSAFVSLIEKECTEGRLSNFCDIVEYSHDIFGDQITFIPTSRTDGRLAAYILGVRDLL